MCDYFEGWIGRHNYASLNTEKRESEDLQEYQPESEII